jgi:hypothetical protein
LQVLVASEEAPAHATDLDENQHEQREYDYADDGHGSESYAGRITSPTSSARARTNVPGAATDANAKGFK